MSLGKHSKKQKLFEIRKQLVDNLDDFLLDDNQEKSPGIDRRAALAALDRLIKQDLVSDNAILKFKENKAEQEALVQRAAEDARVRSTITKVSRDKIQVSSNILNLREIIASKEAEKAKTKYLENWQLWQEKASNQWQKLFQKTEAEENIEYYRPIKQTKTWQLPTWRWSFNGIGRQLIAFALIIFVLLLPIRGLVLFGKLSKDKDRIWQLGQTGLFNLQSGAISASENYYDQASANFQQALANFEEIQSVLNEYEQWLLKTGELLPVVGKPLAVSKNLLSVGENISQAALILNTKLQSQSSLTDQIKFIQEQISKTLPYLTAAAEDIDDINISRLPKELQDYFTTLENYLPDMVISLDNLNQIFDVLLEVLGHGQEKRYLLLFQNNNELRATGGFIGSFALIDMYQGQIKNLEIPKGGSYDLTAGQTVKMKSPKALSLINPYFNIWDANWWSDFPTSAQKIEWFFANAGGSSVDGVIAVNANVLQDLLVITGPVYMPEYEVTISSENVFKVLQEEVELNYDKELNQPKAIIAELAPKLLEIILNSSDKHKEIVAALAQELATKDIQLYLNNKNIQEKVFEYGWSGSVLPASRDYLQVVSTNIGGGKTDKDIYQTIEHQAEIANNGEIINTIKITRTNRGSAGNILAGINGGNVSYLRVHVPLGSEFISAAGFDSWPENYFQNVAEGTQSDDSIEQEENKMIDIASQTEIFSSLGKTVFANWVALAPGETQTVSLKYKLPFKLSIANQTVNNWWQTLLTGDIELDNYSLLVQSQSGDRNTVFNSSILLPSNLKVVWNKSSAEEQMSINDHLVTFTDQLISDQYFGFIVTVR